MSSCNDAGESASSPRDERRPYARKMCAYQLSRAAVADEGSGKGAVKTADTGCGSDAAENEAAAGDCVSGSVVEKNGKVSSGISCAIDPACLELEYKLARFVENADVAEYRFTGKLSQNQRNNIRRIADERDLILRVLGKGKDKCVALRKKARFHHRQKVARELQAELQRMKESAQGRRETASSCDSGCGPDDRAPVKRKGVEMCIQTDPDPAELARQKAVAKRAATVKVDSDTQTCPEFFYVCMYCEKDIPEAIKSFHHVQCLREWKARRAAARVEEERREMARIRLEEEKMTKQRPCGTPQDQARRLLAKEKARKSKNTRPDRKQEEQPRAVKKSAKTKSVRVNDDPFEKVHDNDINGLLSAARRLDCPQNRAATVDAGQENAAANDAKSAITGFEKAQLKKHLRERLTILAERRK